MRTCHLLDQQGRCPNLRGLYSKPVQLTGGRTVLADEAYIRESILKPNAKIVPVSSRHHADLPRPDQRRRT